MILLIDNYDSFTFNLFQYLSMLGEIVKVVRNDEIDIKKIKKLAPKAIVLSPGPKTPDQAGICLDVVRELYSQIPILGICLGHQSIGQAFGGKIIRAPRIMHGKLSNICHTGTIIYKNIENPFLATRYHSLIIDKKTLPKELNVTAQTDDGIIMGVAHKEFPVYGLQFHPESIKTEVGLDLLRNFLEGIKKS